MMNGKRKLGTKTSGVKWMDTKSVCLVSSFTTSWPTEKCSRHDKNTKDRVETPTPNIVADCNKHMGGVDLCDQLLAYYRMTFKAKKYYQRLVFHLLDMTVVNCWLQYRRSATAVGVSPFS